MIKRFWGRNVGVLGNFSVDLEPLTVLVGPNASGKSTFLRALRCIAMLTKMPAHGRLGALRLGYRTTIADLVSNGQADAGLTLGIEIQQDQDQGEYEITVKSSDGHPQIQNERAIWKPRNGTPFAFEGGRPNFNYYDINGKQFSSDFPRDMSLPLLCSYLLRNDPVRRDSLRSLYKLVDAFAPLHVFRFSPASIAKPSRVGDELQHDGAGIAAYLDDLVGRDRAAFARIAEKLGKLFPHIRQVNLETLKTPGGGKRGSGAGEVLKAVVFEREDGTVQAEFESDGVLLSLAHLCLSEKRTDPAVAVEEPETGTYPSLLAHRFDLFRDIAYGRLGYKPRQVLLTTHSPTLLSYAGEPSLIRIFERKDGGGVSIYTPPELSVMEVVGRRLSWAVGT